MARAPPLLSPRQETLMLLPLFAVSKNLFWAPRPGGGNLRGGEPTDLKPLLLVLLQRGGDLSGMSSAQEVERRATPQATDWEDKLSFG
ncbi:hypothetical protein INR49_026573, partial [Caranx melampygus]